MIRFEDFGKSARGAVRRALTEAVSLRHNYIGTEHLLLGVLAYRKEPAARALAAANVTGPRVRKALDLLVGRGDEKPDEGTIGMTPRAKRVIKRADRFAGGLGTKTIGTEHLLLGILSIEDGMAARVLGTLGSDPQQVEANLWRELEAASV